MAGIENGVETAESDGGAENGSVTMEDQVFRSTLAELSPRTLVLKSLRFQGAETLDIEHVNIDLLPFDRYSVIAFGKAALAMTEGLLDAAQTAKLRISSGVISCPATSLPSPSIAPSIRIHYGAANNLPDAEAEVAAAEVLQFAEGLTASDLCFVLISGGGSALLPAMVEGVDVGDEVSLIKHTLCGATIQELNTVRQAISTVKGGRLAQTAAPATLVCLILSDIVSSPTHLIASGPTVRRPATVRRDALRILERYGKERDETVKTVMKVIECVPETETEIDWTRIHNFVIGDNRIALNALSRALQDTQLFNVNRTYSVMGSNLQPCDRQPNAVPIELTEPTGNSHHHVHIISDTVVGEASRVGEAFAGLLLYLAGTSDELSGETVELLRISRETMRGIKSSGAGRRCLLFGGETTVSIDDCRTDTGNGRQCGLGGRNQEMALAFALAVANNNWLPTVNFAFASLATDGQDGPTDATGVIVERSDLLKMNSCMAAASESLSRHDSYNFWNAFSGGNCLLKTGLTGTNVMDLQLLIVETEN